MKKHHAEDCKFRNDLNHDLTPCKCPGIITSFPGETVDRHLKAFGHLPSKGCCKFDQ